MVSKAKPKIFTVRPFTEKNLLTPGLDYSRAREEVKRKLRGSCSIQMKDNGGLVYGGNSGVRGVHTLNILAGRTDRVC